MMCYVLRSLAKLVAMVDGECVVSPLNWRGSGIAGREDVK